MRTQSDAVASDRYRKLFVYQPQINTMKILTLFLVACMSLTGTICFSQPGSLDSTFGGDGTVKTDIAIGGAFPFSAVLQADEKIVLEGHTLLKDKLIIARLKTDGSLDSSFGLNGAAVYDSLRYNESHNALALQTDGKIVLATNRGSVDFAVIRFLQNGTLDSSFGSNGRAATKFLEGDNISSAVAIQPDGKIVVAGSAIVNNYWHGFALARYNANGTIDSSFGSNGISRDLPEIAMVLERQLLSSLMEILCWQVTPHVSVVLIP